MMVEARNTSTLIHLYEKIKPEISDIVKNLLEPSDDVARDRKVLQDAQIGVVVNELFKKYPTTLVDAHNEAKKTGDGQAHCAVQENARSPA